MANLDSADWTYVPECGDTPAYSIYRKSIEKGVLDDREYRIIALENGLQAVLVHDAKADKSAASLEVSVGHLRDPDDIPGLAHFCEHLLFLGTKPYPRENEYKEYLSKNGGSSNAGTGTDYTNYYFNVNAAAFLGALDRFSAFFHSPLFNPSCTLREMNAVDSENKKNLQNDSRRVFQLSKHLSKPGHVWAKFGTGNKKTLLGSVNKNPVSDEGKDNSKTGTSDGDGDDDGGSAGRETRRRLIEWWSKEYCASRMSLAVVAKENIEELMPLVVKLFSPILNRGRDPLPIIAEHPYGENEYKTLVRMKTVQDIKEIKVYFQFPDTRDMWRSKPAQILTEAIGHEGPGSIFAYLKRKSWVLELSAGVSSMARGIAQFILTLTVTDEGFAHYREVLLALFKSINFYRSTPPSDSFYSEMQRMYEIAFRFKEKISASTYVQQLAKSLKLPYPRELLLCGQIMIFERANTEIKRLFDILDVDRCRVILLAREHSFDASDGNVEWLKEPWYGTEYTSKKFDDYFLTQARLPNDIPELKHPEPNNYIPENLDVDKLEVKEPRKKPTLLKRTPTMDVWHKKDDQFWVPKGTVVVDLRSPIACSSPRARLLTKLFIRLVDDSLEEITYDAVLAGLSFTISDLALGFRTTVSGFNDKLHVLLRTVLEKVRSLQIMDERLSVIKEKIRKDFENQYYNEPYSVSGYYSSVLFTDCVFDKKAQLKELATISINDLDGHRQELLSHSAIRMLVVGNIRQADALEIAKMIEDIIEPKQLPNDTNLEYLSRLLPPSCNYVWETHSIDPAQINGCVYLYVHIGDVGIPHVRVTSHLLVNLLREPAFSTLRTKEQLGYIVSTTALDDNASSIGIRILVQSRKDTKYVESRIEKFLEDMKTTIEEMSDEQFEQRKTGLIQDWTQKLKNLKEERIRFYYHISNGYFDFCRSGNDAELLRGITKAEVLDYFNRYVDPSSESRSKFSIHLRPQNAEAIEHTVEGDAEIRSKAVYLTCSLDEFKATLRLSEPPIPVENFEGGLISKF